MVRCKYCLSLMCYSTQVLRTAYSRYVGKTVEKVVQISIPLEMALVALSCQYLSMYPASSSSENWRKYARFLQPPSCSSCLLIIRPRHVGPLSQT